MAISATEIDPGALVHLIQARAVGSLCEPAHNVDQLVMGGAGRIAEFSDRVRVGEIAQPNEFRIRCRRFSCSSDRRRVNRMRRNSPSPKR